MILDEFIKQYAERSEMTVEEILKVRVPVRCDCGDELCEGWMMVSTGSIFEPLTPKPEDQ